MVHWHLRFLLQLLEGEAWLIHRVEAAIVLKVGHEGRRGLRRVLFKWSPLHVAVVELGGELRVHELTLTGVHVHGWHHHLHVVLLLG